MRDVEMPSGKIRKVPEKGKYTKAERAAIARIRKVNPGISMHRANQIAKQEPIR